VKWSAILLTLVMLVPVLMVMVPSVQAGDIPENMPIVPVKNETIEYVHPLDIIEGEVSQRFFVVYANMIWNPLGWYWQNLTTRTNPDLGTVRWISGWEDWYDDWVTWGDPADIVLINNSTIPHTDMLLPFNLTGAIVLADRLYMECDAVDLPFFLIYKTDAVANFAVAAFFKNVTHQLVNTSAIPDWVLGYASTFSGDNLPYYEIGGNAATIITDTDIGGYRETSFRLSSAFNYSYYTTQKRYEATRTILNNGLYNWTDVNWFVGFPENRSVDPGTVKVYDLNNGIYLKLGENYDVTQGGIRMSFDHFPVGLSRSFTFDFYGYNASQGLGTAIAFSDTYVPSKIGNVDYYKSVPTWTNNYGRIYQGAVFIQLSFDDGKQRYIDPSSVKIYDTAHGVFLEPWEFAVNGGLIIVGYTIVPVGSEQSYDVYFKIDYNQMKFDIFAPLLVVFGIPISLFVFLVLAWIGLFVWTLVSYSPNKLMVMLIFGSIIGGYYILYALGYV